MVAEQSTVVAVTKTNFEVELANYEPQIAVALPAHISAVKFRRVVMTAVSRNPDLYTKSDRRSLFISCVDCATDGLLPDGREAALVLFGNKVQYMPMVRGVIKRMRNSGDVAAVDAQVVYEKDHFDYQLGDDPKIVHRPTLGDPGKPIGAYAIITLDNGEKLREVMSVAQIEKVRAVSRARKDSPWINWWEEMARKTVLRRCAKRAPVSPDLERFLTREDFPQIEHHREMPARPTRAEFAEPDSQGAEANGKEGAGAPVAESGAGSPAPAAEEPFVFELYDEQGEEVLATTDGVKFCQVLSQRLLQAGERGDGKAIDTLWINNQERLAKVENKELAAAVGLDRDKALANADLKRNRTKG